MTRKSPVLIACVAAALVFLLAACATTISGDDREARTPRRMIDDEDVEQAAKRLILASDAQFESAHVIVVCYDGVVLLSGQVENEALKTKATDALQGLDGVKAVHNELEIGVRTSLPERMGDAWITTKVKSAMATDPTVDASRINVTTVDGVVYLMGDLTHREADDAVALTQTISGPRKIVKAFEYVD